jgi:hypothetical protein
MKCSTVAHTRHTKLAVLQVGLLKTHQTCRIARRPAGQLAVLQLGYLAEMFDASPVANIDINHFNSNRDLFLPPFLANLSEDVSLAVHHACVYICSTCL